MLSPLSDGAAAVVCSAGADRDALAEALAGLEEVTAAPVDSGVSSCGMDMAGSVVWEREGTKVLVTDAKDVGSVPADGRDTTGSDMVTSPSLTLLGTGSDSTGKLIAGSSLVVAEPTSINYSTFNKQKVHQYAHA